jgi:hypothetical protein
MQRKRLTPAEFALLERKLNASKPKRKQAQAPKETEIPSAVNGGFRAGKRRRGNSLLKRKPRASTLVTTYNVRDEHGDTVATIRTLNYKRNP